jgi:uncharacterized membrane protein
MAVKNFSVSEALSFGWQKVKENWTFFVPLGLIVLAIQSIPKLAGNRTQDITVSFLVTILVWLLRTVVDMGVIKISLKTVDGKKADWNDLFSQTDRLKNFLIGSIIYTLIVIGGLILLIVPGIIWAIKYSYFSYLIVDKNLEPMEAIRKSGQITDGHKMELFIFALALGGINILGALIFGIGLIITLPVSYLAYAYVYRKLSSKA